MPGFFIFELRLKSFVSGLNCHLTLHTNDNIFLFIFAGWMLTNQRSAKCPRFEAILCRFQRQCRYTLRCSIPARPGVLKIKPHRSAKRPRFAALLCRFQRQFRYTLRCNIPTRPRMLKIKAACYSIHIQYFSGKKQVSEFFCSS